MKRLWRIRIGFAVAGIIAAGVVWFNYGHMPGYEHLFPHDLLRIRQAIRRHTFEPIVRIIPDGPGAVRVMTGKRGSGLDGGGIEYQLNETSSGWEIVGRSGWMSALPNQRPGVDAGWPLLFAFSSTRPRATQAERSASAAAIL